MYCDQCGSENPDVALFCKDCGSTQKFPSMGSESVQFQLAPTINFSKAMLLGFRKYFQVSGRSSRAEFWWFILFQQICALAMIILSASPLTVSFIAPIGCLILSIPFITITTRRLHDIGLSGWWQLLFFLGTSLSSVGTLTLLLLGFFTGRDKDPILNSTFFIGSGLLFLLLIGLISMWIKLLSREGQHGQNKFGKDPKEYGDNL